MKQAIKDYLKRCHSFWDSLRSAERSSSPPPASNAENKPQYNQKQKKILEYLDKKNTIYFVQVGSNDGVQEDTLHDIIMTNNNWRGIFIEPVGYLFNRLKRNYGKSDRFIFENKAIAPDQGKIEFFYVSEKAKTELGDTLPYWYDQLGSFDKNHILKHLDGILEPYIVSERIVTVPLQDIFDKHGVTEIDLIQIDTEGYDYKVLTTIDFTRYKPCMILYEHKHLTEIERNLSESLLKKYGYECMQYGSDTMAVLAPERQITNT